ncbi:Fe-Mn family superoxide dismutase [Algiphilus sp.]|uniref:superoxide dismutase n=1 Tax=Algiphilus sp. TaxID=1872431 RepID=UPI001CA5F54F|nr:Fe-Mn family superoxide dismutase [Algiphilus sp.]MBY8966517.1 superoxide dismutase [Algiphilus acroporae]MCI5062208.1 superoxide dismutase [Algiphilus sp.]MCI5104496.1 superoxide dismutase [Algiphilus sp.]MCR9092121.1 superoxide dismutase [Pseudomonadota bacterium]
MALTLPDLPYAREALEPHMSAETLDYHHGKHHKTYVDTANNLISGTEYEQMPLEEIIVKSSGKLFNQTAQIWNHSFFWQCLTPNQTQPGKKLTDALVKEFGGIEDFKKLFTETAIGTFGSGWAWLVKKPDGSLAVTSTSNAGTPLTDGDRALLTCDVWEHAYYIDHRNARPKYLEAFWQLVNWEFVEQNLG